MGTRWRVRLVAGARAALAPLHEAIQSSLDAVVAQMSTWQADSDISRYNRAAAGSTHALPRAFADVLRCALDVAEASGGAFDPTVGPLVALWGFGAHGDGHRVPATGKIADVLSRVGWRRIDLRADGSLAQPGGVQLDLSAIAKGHGVDAVAACLRAHGIAAALVDVGGELHAHGRKPDGSAWQVLVEAGDEATDEAPCVLTLDDAAVASSGTRWHRFEHDGRGYAHTIDPRSGAPVAHAPVAVTVVADDAMHADAWATALTVMGVEQGLAFARARGLAARFVPAAGEACMTPTFAARLAR
ncbi:MAG TPA: FAD:protein FMN transferase [Luteimonas sp.]|nr:FAD:protein FMN transferase [Luteimonas sp.]